jgi:hypothetical protein
LLVDLIWQLHDHGFSIVPLFGTDVESDFETTLLTGGSFGGIPKPSCETIEISLLVSLSADSFDVFSDLLGIAQMIIANTINHRIPGNLPNRTKQAPKTSHAIITPVLSLMGFINW